MIYHDAGDNRAGDLSAGGAGGGADLMVPALGMGRSGGEGGTLHHNFLTL
jgi:hypothetical protein